jgi:small subunit ribosomal protein S18
MGFKGGKKKYCPFASGKVSESNIDYKNFRFLRKYVTDTGKIVPKRITWVENVYQRMLAEEIKYARYLALIGFCDRH